VNRIIDNALTILQHPKSFKVLTQMGMEAVESWRKDQKPVIHQGHTVDDMEAALRRYLGKLHDEQFYPIELLNTKRKWPHAGGQIFAQFEPQECKQQSELFIPLSGCLGSLSAPETATLPPT
jgi:hypothetical protein